MVLLKLSFAPIAYIALAYPNHTPLQSYMKKVVMLMQSDTSSIAKPADLETISFNVSSDDDLSIAAPALQNASASISYTCTVSPFPASSSTAKSGASGTQELKRTQLVGYLLPLILATWALVI